MHVNMLDKDEIAIVRPKLPSKNARFQKLQMPLAVWLHD